MSIARTFLDWSRPALPSVVAYLRDQFRRGAEWDLDNVVLVVPGGRAGRALIELLVTEAAARDLTLFPPRHCTMGALPELLYESKRPFASDLVQQLAWIQAVRDVGPESCQPLIPHLPLPTDYAGWMKLGSLLQRQHRELSADALDFAAVARRGKAVPGFQEADRWLLLSEVQKRYLTILDGLGLWDLQTARLFAIDHRLCRTDKQIVLVGTSDMNVAMRRMLDQVADHVTALVHANQSEAERFDEHGCLIPQAWEEVPIPLTAEQLRVVQSPADQAEAVVATIAELNGEYRGDQIVVGVLDEQLVPQLKQSLEDAGLETRWVVGTLLGETAPFRLLSGIAGLLQRGRYREFAALARHPDVETWLLARGVTGDCLGALDAFYNDHLPTRLGDWPEEMLAGSLVRQIYSALQEALQPLWSGVRPLADWASEITQLLQTFYGDRVLSLDAPSDHYLLKALETLRTAIDELRCVPPSLAPIVPAARAIDQVLEAVRMTPLPAPHAEAPIEMLGWLELPLDSAPVLIAAGFNDGNVPTSVNSDLFLPNSLRQQLELLDNRRRYARDAYALSALLASRQRLTLIAGRRTAEGDPLLPSRLAFATEPVEMARRAKQFFDAKEGAPAEFEARRIRPPRAESGFVVREPAPLSEPVTSMNVTAFRLYLACPYRFYLSQVLKLRICHDEAEELGPDTFGTLLHEVLKRFGTGEVRDANDPVRIQEFLFDELAEYVVAHFGPARMPALEVQLEQLRRRLAAFADWQAHWADAGWRIRHVETDGGESRATLRITDKIEMALRGRIDRIDERDGEFAIFDYKTGDKAKTPAETHLKGGEWVDLQLPLYRHIARSLGIRERVQLGYIVLPKDVAEVGSRMAEWNTSDLDSADLCAKSVAKDVYEQHFWPPRYPAPVMLSDFAWICQDDALRRQLKGLPRTEEQA